MKKGHEQSFWLSFFSCRQFVTATTVIINQLKATDLGRGFLNIQIELLVPQSQLEAEPYLILYSRLEQVISGAYSMLPVFGSQVIS